MFEFTKTNVTETQNLHEHPVNKQVHCYFVTIYFWNLSNFMLYVWDGRKPDGINDKTWRRQQIANFIDYHPDCKPKDVLAWLSSHTTNPCPLAAQTAQER